ncbi:hypothetical protein ACJX0J_041788, partial [Zea mays]
MHNGIIVNHIALIQRIGIMIFACGICLENYVVFGPLYSALSWILGLLTGIPLYSALSWILGLLTGIPLYSALSWILGLLTGIVFFCNAPLYLLSQNLGDEQPW